MESSDATLTTTMQDDAGSLIALTKKLKQTEDRIYQAKHRLDCLNVRSSKHESKLMRSTHMSSFRDEVREFAESQRKIKQQQQMRKSQQLQHYHELNMERRLTQKEKLKELRETVRDQNRWVHDEIRRQKEENQKSIEKARRKEKEDKKTSRDYQFESEQRRLAYMREFLKNKELTAKLRKAEQISCIKSRIAEGEKLIEKLEHKGSQVSLGSNPEEGGGSASQQAIVYNRKTGGGGKEEGKARVYKSQNDMSES